MITIYVEQIILASPPQVIAQLLKHNQQHLFFNAKFELLQTEDRGEVSGGKGTLRQVKIGFIHFVEEIMLADDEHISYKIVGNSPVREHQGDIFVSTINEQNTQSKLVYIITFKAPKWLPDALLKFFVGTDIKSAMKKLALHFEKIASTKGELTR